MSVCPRCHESVPKTLYCLNCGYPLYREVREEAPVEPSQEEELKAQASSEFAETPTKNEEVEPPEALERPSEEAPEKIEDAMIKVEWETGAIQKVPIELETTAPTGEPVEEAPETEEAVTAESSESVELYTSELIEASPEVEGKPTSEVLEEEAAKEEAMQAEAVKEEEEAIEALEMVEQPAKLEIAPTILEVMDNLAKNISLKLKLVDLAVKGDIKEANLNKLLESYAAKGEVWINRRNEILERGRYEISTLEKAVENAVVGMEELEIRRAIGDASEDEYAAKAPAYEWDINHLNEKLTQKRLEIGHLESLSKIMSHGDFERLKEIASSCHRDIDMLATTGRMRPETVAKIKAILEEALELLKG